jgi:predicted DCC family thiol-disulfide oxidoreductase YuxK
MKAKQCAKLTRRAAKPTSVAINTSRAPWEIEVFFDGECSLCRREIGMLRGLDRKNRIRFTDIAAEDFETSDYGISHQQLMAEIHARLPDGTWINGVEVFRRLYSAVGFRWLIPFTRLPGISCGLELGYRFFARNRLKWTGRCSPESESCQVVNSNRQASRSVNRNRRCTNAKQL